jgi:hypothetical protein
MKSKKTQNWHKRNIDSQQPSGILFSEVKNFRRKNMNKKTIITSVIALGVVGLAVGVAIVTSLNTAALPQYGHSSTVDRVSATTYAMPEYGYNGNVSGVNRTSYNTNEVSDLSVTEVADLEATLTVLINDEYKARAEYVALVEMFGEVSPFTELIEAETQHISALANQFLVYGFDVPEDNGSLYAVVPATLEEAYAIGVEAEVANIALYENFLTQDLPTNIERVFTNLMNASQNHLASFQSYLDGTVPVELQPLNQGSIGRGRTH